jgi:hypothetical protein
MEFYLNYPVYRRHGMVLKHRDTLRFNLRVYYVCGSVRVKDQVSHPYKTCFERIRDELRCILVLL